MVRLRAYISTITRDLLSAITIATGATITPILTPVANPNSIVIIVQAHHKTIVFPMLTGF